jgi:cyclophilin family peptidyl-prolyl cis-trans isomerase
MQVSVLIIILIVFGLLVWLTQKDSFSKSSLPPGLPGVSPSTALPPDGLSPLNQTAQNNQQAQAQQTQQSQQQAQQQEQVVQGPIKEDNRATISAQIKTTKGTISIILYNQEAKLGVKNFIDKARSGFYKNLIFHRVEDWVIQGGDPKGNGTGGGVFQSELNGKSFVTGSLGWAASSNMQVGQGARISNDAQFFIVKSDATWLDPTYTNFGIVDQGMDIVNSIKIGDKILDITVSDN